MSPEDIERVRAQYRAWERENPWKSCHPENVFLAGYELACLERDEPTVVKHLREIQEMHPF